MDKSYKAFAALQNLQKRQQSGKGGISPDVMAKTGRRTAVSGKEFYLNLRKRTTSIAGRSVFVVLLLLIASFLAGGCATWELGSSGQRKIKGKTFVIVGASSGFGRGVAEQAGEYGANVVVAARRAELLEEVASNVRKAGGTALVVPMDISKPEDVQRLADAAVEEYGEIDVWINMAGVGGIGPFWDIPLEDQSRLVDVNLKGFIYGSYEALDIFRKQGYGVLINMGSIESENPLAYHATYAATKGAILRLSQALNQELRLNGHKNIEVVTIEPWAVDTPFWRHAANYSGGTGRMAAMDPPGKVVNAVLRKSLRPEAELAVGWKASATKFSHRLFPRLTERIAGNIVHKYQMENAPPLEPTSGTLHEPMEEGRGVDDNVRERMEEDRQ